MYPVLHSFSQFDREYTDSSTIARTMAFSQTVWPSSPAVPDHIKAVLSLFFEFGDSSSPDSSRRLGEEVFTADGQIVVNKKVISGAQGTLFRTSLLVGIIVRLTLVVTTYRDINLKPRHVVGLAGAQPQSREGVHVRRGRG